MINRIANLLLRFYRRITGRTGEHKVKPLGSYAGPPIERHRHQSNPNVRSHHTRSHNNRKMTPGRLIRIQVIHQKDGATKTIYHDNT